MCRCRTCRHRKQYLKLNVMSCCVENGMKCPALNCAKYDPLPEYMPIISIDPGNTESAYCLIDKDYHPMQFSKLDNHTLITFLTRLVTRREISEVAIEMVACYGMPVGKEVFDTVVWIGRFEQIALQNGLKVTHVFRKDVTLNLCHSMKAKDPNVRQALIDRFASHDLVNGKGTKDKPDWFYGFKADIWAAYGVGVTLLDERSSNELKGAQ